MSEDWVQFYAREFVLRALSQISQGRLTIVSKYEGGDAAPVVLGQPASKDSEDDGRAVSLVINNPNAWTRICQAFDLGFAEAYMLQEVDCEKLLDLFCLYITNRSTLGFGNYLFQIIPRISRLVFRPINDVSHARLNASFHYDTSNELFAAFLSPDMNYSSALWSGDGNPNESLESAQHRKVGNILQKARISPSDHILDIGCGWGHLAMEAVRTTGCRVTGVTLSSEQKTLAEKRIEAAGLQDRIRIVLCDYRDAPRPEVGYDRVVSVEMLEHVGSEYMDDFFRSISRLLKPEGGVIVIQGITIINKIHDNKPNVDTFIDRYVFPGGYLPTVNKLLSSLHAGSEGSLEVESVQSIGPHYIRTLQCWRENFLRNWETIKASYVEKHADATDVDIEAFRRRWVYYFTYCESGFRMRILGDYVISAVRTPEPGIPPGIPH